MKMLFENQTAVIEFYHNIRETITEKVTESVDRIQLQIYSQSMMENLINDLLDLAKMENHKFKINKEYFNLTTTI